MDYQPLHVNFGIMEPLVPPVRNKRERYAAYAARGAEALAAYQSALLACGLASPMRPAAVPDGPRRDADEGAAQ